MSQVDLYASIAALLGEAMPEHAGQDGRNVLPALLGESDTGRSYIIQEALKQLAFEKEIGNIFRRDRYESDWV